jgi:hypothetical protein
MKKIMFLIVLGAASLFVSAQQANIRYVDWYRAGNYSGTSWSNASDNLQAMIDAVYSSGGGEVWVKEGLYKPSYSGDMTLNPSDIRDAAIVMRTGVKIYGGFPQNADDISNAPMSSTNPMSFLTIDQARNTRHWESCSTRLIGFIGTSQGYSYHIIIAAGGISDAVLDGFYIQEGCAATGTGYLLVNGDTIPRDHGGGVVISNASPILRNLTIETSNGMYGGGMYINNSSPVLTNIKIRDNGSAVNYLYPNLMSQYGGGIYIENCNTAYLMCTDMEIYNNIAEYGGGIYCKNSSVELSGITVRDNSASIDGSGLYIKNTNLNLLNSSLHSNAAYAGKGGGIYMDNSPGNTCKFTNILFSNNLALQGGMLYMEDGACTMTNITATKNTSNNNGSVIYCTGGSLDINNSIVYGNIPNVCPYSPILNNIIYNYSLIENGNLNNPGINNIFLPTDPKFLNPGGANYRLSRHSPCCNAGNNGLYQAARGISNFTGEKELSGNSRLYGTAIDMGAYENQGVSHNGSGVFFVKQGATGKQNGSSWADAFDDLATALEEIPLYAYILPEI